MKIIISPAKTMKQRPCGEEFLSTACFLEQARHLQKAVVSLSYEDAKTLWKCSDAITAENRERFQHMELDKNLTPAIRAYDGIQFCHMHLDALNTHEKSYLQNHLRIISGFYGLLRPFDGITPYRLEMQAKISVGGKQNLYEFWGRRIYDALEEENGCIINLASKEYAKAVLSYIPQTVRLITIDFLVRRGDRLQAQSTYAKMGRGEMVSFLAKSRLDGAEIPDFNALGFLYDEEYSAPDHFVFIRDLESI